jgi:phage gp36-like protein
MSQYLTRAEFRAITTMPAGDVDDIEVAAPGWIDAQSTVVSGIIDARLRKRYAAPFEAPYPDVVRLWCSRILTLRAYLRRGVDARDAQFEVIQKDAEAASAEIKEAADSKDGLFELPIRQDLPTTGAIARGGPFGYSEASPYTWTTVQSEAAKNER